MIRRILTADTLDPAWFAPTFSAIDRVDRLRDDLLARHGRLQTVKRQGERWMAVLERATVPIRLTLDESGRVAGLLFEHPIVIGRDLEAAVAAFDSLPGATGLLVLENGAERAARRPNKPLGAGSAFKMLILRELAAAVASGRVCWSTTVALRLGWRAPGSGLIRDWPEGLPISVGTLAALMISLSDNTATEALMEVVGRPVLDAAVPVRNRPLPTPGELLGLRYAGGPNELAAWRSGDRDQRADVLASLRVGSTLPERVPGQLPADIDYFFTARELCDLVDSVAEMPVMRIYPGVADGLGWEWVAFKGGATTTSVSFTICAASGARRVRIAALWNATPAVDEAHFEDITRSLLASLAASEA